MFLAAVRNLISSAVELAETLTVCGVLVCVFWFLVLPGIGWPRVIQSRAKFRMMRSTFRVAFLGIAMFSGAMLVEALTDDRTGGALSHWPWLMGVVQRWTGRLSFWSDLLDSGAFPIFASGVIATIGLLVSLTIKRRLETWWLNALDLRYGARCRNCRYDLSNIPEVQNCPECGTPRHTTTAESTT